MSAFRNPDLHARIEKHPLKAALARCLDIAEGFHTDCEHIGMDSNLSATGRASAVQKLLRSAIRDLRDARKPIEDWKARVQTKRAAVKIPPFDGDTVGFLRRQELRAALKGMTLGERQASLTGANANVDFVDAALEQHPILSGFANNPMEMKIFAAIQEDRLQSLFGPQLAEIAEMEATIAEAEMIVNVARGDISGRSGLQPQQFEQLAKPIEKKANAPWLRREKNQAGDELIIVVDLERHIGRPASLDEIRDGKFYKDHAEYLADRGA